MKDQYIKKVLEKLKEKEDSTIRSMNAFETFTYYPTFVAVSFSIAALFFAWPLSLTSASVAAILLYQRNKNQRMNQQILNRIVEERSHINEIAKTTPKSNDNLNARRKNKLQELVDAKKKKEQQKKSASGISKLLTGCSLAGTVASYFVPALVPLTIGCGISMVIAGEVQAKNHKDSQELENRMNNIGNDLSVIIEDHKDQVAKEKKAKEESKKKEAEKINGKTPKAATNTERENLVNNYVESLANKNSKESVKQKIKK